jgi:hypothetical protein
VIKRTISFGIIWVLLCLTIVSMGRAQEPGPDPAGDLALTPVLPETELPVVAITPEVIPTQTPWIVYVTAEPIQPEPPSLAVPVEEIKALISQQPDSMFAAFDEAIAGWFPWLAARQREYREMTGRYAQMLPSHLEPPADGSAGIPDGWFKHPTDQQYSWPNLDAIRFEPMPFDIRIDVYDGPEGQGYVTCFQVQIKGSMYERCQNYGPEASREHDWRSAEAVK